MFQLIVTLLAIALAALAAIAAAWYGGDAFNSGSAGAQAEAEINVTQQQAAWLRLAAAEQAAGAAVPAQPTAGTPGVNTLGLIMASAQSALGDGACAPWTASPQSGGGQGLVVNGGTACSMPGFTPGGPASVLIDGPLSPAVCAAVNRAAIGAAGSATSGGNTQFGCDPNEVFYYAVPM